MDEYEEYIDYEGIVMKRKITRTTCVCKVSDMGHSAGTLPDMTDLIICLKCGKEAVFNG